MSNWNINGIFLNNRITGIERVAIGMTQQLDLLSKKGEITLVIPPNAPQTNLNLHNILIKRLPKTPFLALKNVKLSIYMFFGRHNCIDYTNHIPFFGKNIVFLHDIYYKTCPQDFISKQDKKEMNKMCRRYKRICKKAKVICTVSEFSKTQIVEHYGIPENKVHVIYNSVEYMDSIKADYTVFQKYPQLKENQFFQEL